MYVGDNDLPKIFLFSFIVILLYVVNVQINLPVYPMGA